MGLRRRLSGPVPPQWRKLLVAASLLAGPIRYDGIDLFCGAGNYRMQMEKTDRECAKFDLLLGDQYDVTKRAGQLLFIKIALETKKGGLALIGPPCQFYIYMSRKQHGKTKANPDGNGSNFAKTGVLIERFVANAIQLLGAVGIVQRQLLLTQAPPY